MARPLSGKTNVIAPGGNYPFGRVKNNTGGNNGTPVDEALLGDALQFFEKLMSLGSVSFNNLPENNSDGFQYITALQAIIQSYITSLKGGVPTAGDTLNKLYTLITAVGRPRGGWDASSNTVPGSASNEDGDFWRITVQGTLSGLASGAGVVKPGDIIFAIGDGATAQSSFYAIQSNVDQATSSVLGLVKLYTDLLASNTDGTVTQAGIVNGISAVDSNANSRVLKSGDTMTGVLVVPGTNTDNVILKTKTVLIGDWNMNFSSGGSASVNVAHGLGANYKKIRSVSVIVRDDTDTNYNSIAYTDSTKVYGGIRQINVTNIELVLITPNAVFDNTNYDATSYNRGWITITYEA